MALQGDLKDFSLSGLLQILGNEEKTGYLHLSAQDTEAKIFFKSGIIINASSTQKEFRLGYFLKSNGILSDQELKQYLQLCKKKGKKLGTLLVEHAHIAKETLRTLLHDQVREIIYSIFLWTEGQFTFHDMNFNVDWGMVTQIKPMEIILEGTRRIDEVSVIKKQIPSDTMVFRVSPTSIDKKGIKVNNTELFMLRLIDGTKNVRQLIDESGIDEYSAYKAFYSLFMSGLIEEAREAASQQATSIDLSYLIGFYNILLLLAHKHFKVMLGKREAEVFEEHKSHLESVQKILLKDFGLNRSIDENTRDILEDKNQLDNPEETVRQLIQGFHILMRQVLRQGKKRFGEPIMQETLWEIREFLSFIKRSQESSRGSWQLVREIENLLGDVK